MTMKGQKGITDTFSMKMESSPKKKLNLSPLNRRQTPSTGMLRSSGKQLRVNKFIIKVQSHQNFVEEVRKKVREIDRGIMTPVDYTTISFTSIEEMRSTFTPNRLKLLSVIRHLKPHSVYQLSKILNRDRRHIMNDIKMLKDLGVLEVKKAKANGRKTSVLTAPYNEIEISLKL